MKYVYPLTILLTGALLTGGTALAGDQHMASQAENSAKQSNGMQQMASDAWLDGKLESAFLFNDQLNSFDIDTEVKNGTAYLSGAVESGIDVDLAGEVAKSVDGINQVENNLTVDSQASDNAKKSESWQQKSQWRQSLDNATLTASIKTKLLLNEHTDGLDINVDSMNGVVTLSGTVGTEAEAELAEKIAANAEGSSKVNNRLQIKSEQS